MSVKEGEYCGFKTLIEEPGVLIVTFNRPESLNASTAPMKRDLVEVLTQTQMDDAIRVVIFTGEGSAFWAGDDLKGYGGMCLPKDVRAMTTLLDKLNIKFDMFKSIDSDNSKFKITVFNGMRKE